MKRVQAFTYGVLSTVIVFYLVYEHLRVSYAIELGEAIVHAMQQGGR